MKKRQNFHPVLVHFATPPDVCYNTTFSKIDRRSLYNKKKKKNKIKQNKKQNKPFLFLILK